MTRRNRILIVVLSFFALAAVLSSEASAQTEEEKQYLLMYFKEEELVVESATRSSKPVTQTAENVTIVTADDIRFMNAHTVADVLNTITGVQVFLTGGPGSSATASVQGSESRHVAVFIDGIPLNNLSDSTAELGSLPVQAIEKIEIIKGPASSAWGSALGGVINIITKSGSGGGMSGMLSASYGAHRTGDVRAEASGQRAQWRYYVTAGRLETDGFRPHTEFSSDSGYAKLSYGLSEDTSLEATVSYEDFSRGIGELPAFGRYVDNNSRTVRSALTLRSSLSEKLDVQLSIWHLRQHYNFLNFQIATDILLGQENYLDDGHGASFKLSWRNDPHAVVLGGDYDSKALESNTIVDTRQDIEKKAVFVNDTIAIGRMTITPGLRYDRTDTNGDFTSPSLGMTYQLAASTLLRAYAAKGFNIPPFSATYGYTPPFHVANPDLEMEKVHSYQAGIETGAGQYLWAKVSLFRHDLENGLSDTESLPSITENSDRERREGMELEMKTVSFHHISLAAGAVFIKARDRKTGETIKSVPQRTYDVGLQYDDGSFKALVKGHYIYWNTAPVFEGAYDDFVVNGQVAWAFSVGTGGTVEVFAGAHNLFESEQYPFGIYQNPGRWYEAGARYVF